MPVPVPRRSKPVAHPVVKKVNCGDGQTIPFQNLTRTLPVSPTGPPPSFGTREQWINSLPSWRRTKPRRIWEDDTRLSDQRVEQDFYRGLTAAGNASVIKGEHAEACIPPLYTLLEAPRQAPTEGPPLGSDGEADDEMSSDYSAMDQCHLDNESQWSATSPSRNEDGIVVENGSQIQGGGSHGLIATDLAPYDQGVYERGAFTPVFEDQSPGTASGQDMGSSPLGPVTPFGEFVDRAVAAAQPYVDCEASLSNDVVSQDYNFQDKMCGPQCYQPETSYQQPSVAQLKEAAPVTEVVTPSATIGYRKLAEPLSDWIANYVWKVCTTGLSLQSMYSRPSNDLMNHYASLPPTYLATSVHSLLLSTLLQPSAVFLAIWYIVRLPVYFGANALGVEHVKEAHFRIALLGDSRNSIDREVMESSAPFRLIVLGCMLANKWLDDHTFSNKTWHNISNVPIHALNRLESLALDIFSYDLTVPSRDWSQWLAHVMSYHLSLASPVHPQPISRPSSNPHSIVRIAIDEIIQAPVACNTSSVPQPVFLGLEERKREKLEKEQALAADVLEIDLDEDGPLREEYLPRRRISGAGSLRSQQSHIVSSAVKTQDWERRNILEIEKPLPPPAKWSPAGDEPIHRERNRVSGQYVAVQAPHVRHVAPYPAPYHHIIDVGYAHQNWAPSGYVPIKPQPTYLFDFPPIHAISQATYNPYPYVPQLAVSHSRSQSLCYEDNLQPRNHMRSYSQSQFEYRCSDLRMTANELAPPREADAQWIAANHYPYPASTFAPLTGYQSTWLRA